MVAPSNLFSFKFTPKIKLGKKGLRAALTGTLVGGFYLAGHFMLPDYYGFAKFDLASIMDMGNITSTILLAAPALAGTAGFVISTTHLKSLRVPALGKGGTKVEQVQQQSEPAAEQPAVQELAAQPVADQVQPAPAAPSMDDTVAMIEDMVSKKMGEMLADVTTMKNEVVSFQGDVGKMKDDITNLTSSFESSLTDLKAFQAEMVNPLNFMRNYFETMDIKSLSDPVQALPQVELQKSQAGQPQEVKMTTAPATAAVVADEQQLTRQPDQPVAAQKDDGDNDDDKKIKTPVEKAVPKEPAELPGFEQPFSEIAMQEGDVSMVDVKQFNGNGNGNGNNHSGQIFSGGLTLGKLMSMVSMFEKLLRDMGPDELEALIGQYRQFGLKTEDEVSIYNVVGMLKDFGMSADEVMVRLYRLGQVMGIKDPQADLEYAKLQARTKSRKIPAEASKERRAAFDG
jgi:hypothetical protein